MGINLLLSSVSLTLSQWYKVPHKAKLIMFLSSKLMNVKLLINDLGRIQETTLQFLDHFDGQLGSMPYVKELPPTCYTFITERLA